MQTLPFLRQGQQMRSPVLRMGQPLDGAQVLRVSAEEVTAKVRAIRDEADLASGTDVATAATDLANAGAPGTSAFLIARTALNDACVRR